jgi:hypothetical protein
MDALFTPAGGQHGGSPDGGTGLRRGFMSHRLSPLPLTLPTARQAEGDAQQPRSRTAQGSPEDRALFALPPTPRRASLSPGAQLAAQSTPTWLAMHATTEEELLCNEELEVD